MRITKKILPFLLSAIMLICSYGGITVIAADIPSAAGHTIVDTCYSPGLKVFVAASKDLSGTSGELLYSLDGESWHIGKTLTNTKHYANPNTRQAVLWWDSQQKFIAMMGGTLLSSDDGIYWGDTGLGKSNTTIDTNGEYLILNSGNKIRVYKDLTEPILEVAFDGSNTYGKAVGITGGDEPYTYFVFDGYQEWIIGSDGVVDKRYISIGGNGVIFDMKYSRPMDGWLIVPQAQGLVLCDKSTNAIVRMNSISLSDGTAVNENAGGADSNEEYVLYGTDKGNLYIAPNAAASLGGSSKAWTEVLPADGTDDINGEIRSISALDDGSFFVASLRGTYIAKQDDDGWKYYDMTIASVELGEELMRIEVPESGSKAVDIKPEVYNWRGEQSAATIDGVTIGGELPEGIEAEQTAGGLRLTVSSTAKGKVLPLSIALSNGETKTIDITVVSVERLDVEGFEELVIPSAGDQSKEYEFSAVVIGTDGLPMMTRKADMKVVNLPQEVVFNESTGLFTISSAARDGEIVLEISTPDNPSATVVKKIKIASRHSMYAEIVSDVPQEHCIPDTGVSTFSLSAKIFDQIKTEMGGVSVLWSAEPVDIKSLEGIAISKSGVLTIQPGAQSGEFKVRAAASDNKNVYAEKVMRLTYSNKRKAKEDIIACGIDADAFVEGDLNLKPDGDYGSKITWKSSDESLVKPDGTVIRPSREDKKVRLSASARLEGETAEKTYELTVRKADNLCVPAEEENEYFVTLTNDSSYAFEATIKVKRGERVSLMSETAGKLAQITADGTEQTIKATHSFSKQKSVFQDKIYFDCGEKPESVSVKVYEITLELDRVQAAVNKALYSKSERDIEAAKTALNDFYELPIKQELLDKVNKIKPTQSGGGIGGGGGGGGASSRPSGGAIAPSDVPSVGTAMPIGSEAAPNNDDLIDTFMLKFKDMKYHWAREEVEFMAEQGLLNGKAEGVFDPDAQVTRAEFAAMISRVMNLGEVPYENSFFDVVKEDWYSGYVQAVKSNGLMTGYDGLFDANTAITREEMAKVIVAAYNNANNRPLETGKALYFKDITSISYWAYDYIADAVKLGFIKGMTEDIFAPKSEGTRAEAAVMLKRVYDAIHTAE